MGKVTAAHLLVRTLRRHGVDRIFGLCGDHVNSIFNACLDEGVQVIDTRHESGATHMADAWARVTGTPGVAVVTGGPGHTNSLTGIATAWMAGSPILAISGQYETTLAERGALQELDQVGLVRGITKWARVVTDPARLPEYVALGLRVATEGRTGPVHLSIPVDVSSAEVDEDQVAMPPVARREAPAAPAEAIEAALERLKRAERPVAIAGSGVWWGRGVEPLRRLVETTHVPCFTIGLGRGTLPDDHPLCLGYADPLLNPVAREIPRADVILLLGKRIDFRLGYGRLLGSEPFLIQVDLHAPELGRNRPAQLALHADCGQVLRQLARAAEGQTGWRQRPWVEELRRARRAAEEARRADEHSEASPLHPLRLTRELRERFDGEVVYAIDGGDFAQWCRLGLPARQPGHWLRLGALGTVGAAIPFGIAAKLARPGVPVVILIGDGGFAMNGWELHTALRHGAPVLVVVGNDRGWGMERQLQAAFYDRTVGVELGLVRYDRVVEAMGGHGEHVEHPAQLRPALDRALGSGKVACLNVMIQGLPSPLTQSNIARHKS